MAKERDFKDLANYLMKEPQVALRLRLYFIQGREAHDLKQVNPQYTNLMASELVDMGQLQQENSLVTTKHFYNFWRDLKSNNGTALGSRVFQKHKENTITREGAAVFKSWKLHTWLKAEEAHNANWIINDKTRAILVARDDGSSYTYQVHSKKAKIIPELKNGKLGFIVKIHTNGMVMEETGENPDFSKTKNLEKVDRLFTKFIKKQVESAITKSQRELKADYLGFGRALKQHQLKVFQQLNWEETFPAVPIRVEVECEVKSSGLQT